MSIDDTSQMPTVDGCGAILPGRLHYSARRRLSINARSCVALIVHLVQNHRVGYDELSQRVYLDV
jgi:hypothetical protein